MLLSEPVSQVKPSNMFLSLPYCERSLLLSVLHDLCLPNAGNSPVICCHQWLPLVKLLSLIVALLAATQGMWRLMWKSKSTSAKPGWRESRFGFWRMTCDSTSLFKPRSSFLSFVAAREAACHPGASDREHAASRSHHHVLHPQACECCSCQHLYSGQLCTSAVHLLLTAF